MQNEWILDVLVDLKSFAQQNGLKQLEMQLDIARSTAKDELAQIEKGLTVNECSPANGSRPTVGGLRGRL